MSKANKNEEPSSGWTPRRISLTVRALTASYFTFLGVAAYVFSKSRYRKMLNFMSFLPHWDKYFHFCATGLLCFLVNTILSFRTFRIGRVRILWGTLIAMFMSVSDEYSQKFIPGRVFDIWDVAAACSGALVLGWIGLILYEGNFKNPILSKVTWLLRQSGWSGSLPTWLFFWRKEAKK